MNLKNVCYAIVLIFCLIMTIISITTLESVYSMDENDESLFQLENVHLGTRHDVSSSTSSDEKSHESKPFNQPAFNKNLGIHQYYPSLSSVLKRTKGHGWSIIEDWWEDKENINKDKNFTCHWSTYTSSTGITTDFCVFPFKDVISDSVRRVHRWGDCLSLPVLWKNATKKEHSIYVEIGANQGTCVIEMLLSTDANIIAFEPHPMNLFNLRNTIGRLDPAYQKRVLLIPIALGNETEEATIHAAYNNMGNSVVGQFVEDYRNQSAPDEFKFTIQVERLDSILDPHIIHIPLMKMDAQGYECRIMDGIGSKIAEKIDNIKFEYARNCLKAQGCTNLLAKVRQYGFSIYKSGKLILQEKVNFKLADLWAKRDIEDM